MWLVICSKICLRSVFPNNINYTERKKYNENESQKKRAFKILKDTVEEVFYIGNKGGFLTHNMKENGDIFNELGYIPVGEKAYLPEPYKEVGTVIKKTISKSSF